MLHIRVPATSANLGAGFDCMGLALPLYNEIKLQPSERLIIHTDKGILKDRNNLIIRAMSRTAEFVGQACPNVEMWQINRIPFTSGLGSSAACIVAGITAGAKLCGVQLSVREMLGLATELDGHPDNVAPAILGGITASVLTDHGVETFKASASDRYKIALMTPDFPLSTKECRAVLPKSYSREDLVFAVTHAVTTYAAFLSGDPERIGKCLADRTHEPYRLPLIAHAEDVLNLMKDSGAYATYLSGAGPTLAAVVAPDFTVNAPNGWTLRVLSVCDSGVEILSE